MYVKKFTFFNKKKLFNSGKNINFELFDVKFKTK